MIPCVRGKKNLSITVFRCYFRINKGHDHILLVDDKKSYLVNCILTLFALKPHRNFFFCVIK